jgi:hypothetical protein
LQLHVSTRIKYDTKAGSAVKEDILALIKIDTTFAPQAVLLPAHYPVEQPQLVNASVVLSSRDLAGPFR